MPMAEQEMKKSPRLHKLLASKSSPSQVERFMIQTIWSKRIVALQCQYPKSRMYVILQLVSLLTFQAGKKLGSIPRPIPAPKSLPDPGDISIDFTNDKPDQKPDLNAIQRHGPEKSFAKISGPKGEFSVPTFAELGLKDATTPHRGGETIALKTLDKLIKDTRYTATFEKPKTAPTDFEPQATTLLSPHMHFGSLSVREFYWRVQDVVTSFKGKASYPPVSLTGQLLFRDMYFGAQASIGFVFSQSFGNPKVRYMPWHLPTIISKDTGLGTGEYEIDSKEAEEWFQRWKWGKTGFPFIDALMRQLRQEGWIHHLGRHAVACFLTRGGCYVDWERGADVFEEWLIDHEVACNAGNWQWLSCTAFFSQYYRVYSPIAFGQKWDPNGDFVRRYVPELKDYDKKYIYEPWKTPIVDQKKWGCLIKGDGSVEDAKFEVYPKPIFDFAERRTICLQAMKKAYEVGLHGDDKRVKDGSWKTLFEEDSERPSKKRKI
jgi:cryptochrome